LLIARQDLFQGAIRIGGPTQRNSGYLDLIAQIIGNIKPELSVPTIYQYGPGGYGTILGRSWRDGSSSRTRRREGMAGGKRSRGCVGRGWGAGRRRRLDRRAGSRWCKGGRASGGWR
jgi:hypothetical protein